MTAHDLVRVAARNNAEWGNAFVRTHGLAGRFDDDVWWSAERTPPLYPDAVTLAPAVDVANILSRVDAGAGCSIKDSFGDLDLAGDGFDVLFRAQWLRLEDALRPVAPAGWSIVESTEELAKWETTWGDSPEPPPFFRPGLLVDESIAVLARCEGDRIVAGAIANRSATAIGLSNVFDERDELDATFVGAATAARERWTSLPVVGYESGPALEAALRVGFIPIGELAVWAVL